MRMKGKMRLSYEIGITGEGIFKSYDMRITGEGRVLFSYEMRITGASPGGSYSLFLFIQSVQSPPATPAALACGGNEYLWRKSSLSFRVRSGMFSSFDDSSRAALAPLARINLETNPQLVPLREPPYSCSRNR